ncbi:MAG: hypothetical protein U0326_35200 [Polyangiales bacterium]
MGYRRFTEKTTLTDARESTEYTFEALDAYPDEAVRELGKPLDAHLTGLDGLEVKRRKARRMGIRANARVRTWDGVCDDIVRELVKDVLGAVRQNRKDALFVALFPTSPTEVVALTLAPELEEFERISSVLAAKTTPAELRKAWASRVDGAAKSGNDALKLRKAALAAQAEAEADIARAIERLDRARRAVDGALTTYAAEHDLASDFNERFFPATSTSTKKPSPTPDNPTPA